MKEDMQREPQQPQKHGVKTLCSLLFTFFDACRVAELNAALCLFSGLPHFLVYLEWESNLQRYADDAKNDLLHAYS